MARPVIALLTDFGTRDHYVGTMKGVAVGICPDAALVDITHDIPPQDVLAGALELAAAYKYFPLGTVFLVVVDPGVGTERRGLAVECAGYRFVAPDNGVLGLVLDEHPVARAVVLTEQRYSRDPGNVASRTFEGRDRFAPAAAWIAEGEDMGAFGPPAADLVRLDVPRPSIDADRIAGEVVRVDRFGNLITNIGRPLLDRMGEARVSIAGRQIPRLVATYSDVAPGELCALVSSTEHLEIAVNGGSAAERLGAGRRAAVTVTRRA